MNIPNVESYLSIIKIYILIIYKFNYYFGENIKYKNKYTSCFAK